MPTKNIQQSGEWYIINKAFYFWPEEVESNNLIQLLMKKWSVMKYGSSVDHTLDFPWEYDLWWVHIRCWDDDWMLSYVVRDDWKALWLLATAGVLDIWTFEEIDTFYCLTQAIADEVDKLDFESDVVVLATLEDE